jgi:20S proteasome alpha/beta subunit
MTTVLGIKSNDGIIFASDTQATGVYKDVGVSKIFRINKSMGIGLAGYVRHINLLKREFQNIVGDSSFARVAIERKN